MYNWVYFRKAGLLGPALLFILSICLGLYYPEEKLTPLESFVQIKGSAGSVIRCDYVPPLKVYRTYILTANHVIPKEDQNKLTFPKFDKYGRQVGRKAFSGKVLLHNKRMDFAILLTYTTMYIKPVIVNVNSPSLMDQVYTVGCPLGKNVWITHGEIANLNMEPYLGYIGHTATSIMGNSGGPLFNSKGELIGICNGVLSLSGIMDSFYVTHMVFSLSASSIQKFYPSQFRNYFQRVKGPV